MRKGCHGWYTWEKTEWRAKGLVLLSAYECLQDTWEASVVPMLRDTGMEQMPTAIRDSCLEQFWTTEFWGSLPGPVRCEERKKVSHGYVLCLEV